MKTVLITGATSGIGAATARPLLDQGHNVAVTGRNKDKLRAFVDATGRPDRLLGIAADAADWAETRDTVERTLTRFGSLDAAVANAGFTSPITTPPATFSTTATPRFGRPWC
jgi:NAD(P)-dependent dehydrogenase (short-subunit alcohol dehydrogenase family)